MSDKERWHPGPYRVNRAPGHPTDAGILGLDGKWLGACPKEQADLYAAAPGLYECLSEIVDAYGLGLSPERFVAHIESAIDRARIIDIPKAKGATPCAL
jgi:hypothetical protein